MNVHAGETDGNRWIGPGPRRGFPAAHRLALLATLAIIGATRAVATELISVSRSGTSGNAPSSQVASSGDGSVVAFSSDATNLVVNDTNQVRDVFVRDRATHQTERVSVSTAGVQGDRASDATGGAPAVNGDGSIVAFHSDATNLVADDTNGQTDVFVRVRGNSPSTERVSLGNDGAQGNGASVNPSVSSDGRFVAFQSQASNLVPNDTNGVADIFVRDRVAGTTERVCDATQANGPSSSPAISADGTVVAFASSATNLVPGDTNDKIDIFVCDRRTGAIERVSVSSAGVQGDDDSILPAISSTGCFVAFKSLADNLVPDDHNGVVDVFLRDRTGNATERISVSYSGGDANEASFPASNLVVTDVNLVSSVFVRDRQAAQTRLVDLNDSGMQANNGTLDIPPSISGDGMLIGFVSLASNLAGNDNNVTSDVYAAANPFAPFGGSSSCCQCNDGAPMCELPVLGLCPTDCDQICNAVCFGPDDPQPGHCATFTPTPTPPTPTPTPGVNDCCQCDGRVPACVAPHAGTCPAGCQQVNSAACLSAPDPGGCATFTPTQTPTNTPGVDDCCQCSDAVLFCARPVAGTCPRNCPPVFRAVCLGEQTPGTGQCATFTPGGSLTPTPSATPTRTVPTATTTPTTTGTSAGTATATGTVTHTAAGTATRTATQTTAGTSTSTATQTTAGTATATQTAQATATSTPTQPQVCAPGTPNGTQCDDGNACTHNDQCQNGQCGGTVVDCFTPDQCRNAGGGTCDPNTGLCSNNKPNGSTCDDGNACTQNDSCQSGVCTGTPIDCSAPSQCRNSGPGTCNPATGFCSNDKPDGSTCDDGNLCTQGDSCQGGNCSGSQVVCADQCHEPGASCDPSTGQCTNPKPDGSTCDDGLFCTNPDSCRSGVCTGPPRNCDDGHFCDGTESCNEATRSCQSSGSPCPPGVTCDEAGQRCLVTPTATPVHFDNDGVGGCAVAPPARRAEEGWLVWGVGPAVLLLVRRRSKR